MLNIMKYRTLLSYMGKLTFTLFCAGIILAGCSNDPDTVNIPHGYKLFGTLGDSHKQKLFLKKLQNNNIDYKISGQDKIIYKSSDTAAFYRIKREVQYDGKISPNVEEAIPYTGKEEKLSYVNKFEEEGIPFRIHKTGILGKEEIGLIKYSQIYGSKVDRILQALSN